MHELKHCTCISEGNGHFVDVLIAKGYTNIWVHDISAKAVEKAKKRLGKSAFKINWIISDYTDFKPPVKFDFWHDRAAFHFLKTEAKMYKYISIAEEFINKNGYLILGTFSENGPTKCSGLETIQYSKHSMSVKFEKAFDKIKCSTEDHTTPL